jgi:hypothetical protein
MNKPYAVITYAGQPIPMNEFRYRQAVADGAACGCGECFDCTAADYNAMEGDAGRERDAYNFIHDRKEIA